MRFLLPTFLALCVAHASATQSQCLRPPLPVKSICSTPPVDTVELSAYQGTWYQLFTYSDMPSPFLSFDCSTANYTADDAGISVFNCFYPGGQTPSALCVNGRATQRPDGGSPSRLQVQFSPQAPPGPYNIAALLGDLEYGYYAAAVYNCEVVNGRPSETWFLLGRSPFRPNRVRRELLWKLRCKGYDVYGKRFNRDKQGKGCKYFKDGFANVPPTTGGRPMSMS